VPRKNEPPLKQSSGTPRPRRLLRFSLASLLLAVALICVSVSHFRVTRENLRLKQENERLRVDLGYLNITDKDKVYLRRLETFEELTWRFRVFLPPNKRYRFSEDLGKVTSSSTMEQHDTQFTLTVAIRRNPDGEWRLKTTRPGHGTTSSIDSDIVQRVIALDDTNLLRRDQEELDPDKPIRLVGQQKKGEFRVWIDLTDRHADTGLPMVPRK